MSNTLEDLAALEHGWDSYGAKPIDQRALQAAREILNTVGQPVPRNDGGVDIVWVVNGNEMSLQIGPDGDMRE